MNPYIITTNTKILEPLTVENVVKMHKLASNEEIRKESLKYDGEFNISNSLDLLKVRVSSQGYSDRNLIYLINDKTDNETSGLAGITGIDILQRRGSLILLMNAGDLKAKESYEPVKVLLNNAFERELRKITAVIYAEDKMTATVLKGFGFSEEGKIKEFVYWKGETYDITVFGILKKNFHQVEY